VATDPAAQRPKVVVLGGGMGALAAAWELSQGPAAPEIHVYTLGWRLGGKGASSRNAARGQRIEEHGIHMLFGYYNQTHGLLRAVYAELDRPPGAPLATWDSAFEPLHHAVLIERVADVDQGVRTTPWVLELPPLPGLPGDPEGADQPSPGRLLVTGLARILAGGETLSWDDPPAALVPLRTGIMAFLRGLYEQVRRAVVRRLRGGAAPSPTQRLTDALLGALHRVVEAAEQGTQADPGPLIAALEAWAQRLSERLQRRVELDDMWRRWWIAADLWLAAARGMLADDVLRKGFEAIDHHELSAWLRSHGASALSVDSAVVQAVYDATFAYRGPAADQRDLSAGVGLRGALLMLLGYRGAFLWRMRAGMGEVVFAPLYQALLARGVRFHFFHAVTELNPSDGVVASVRLRRHAVPRAGAGSYAPLVDVDGLPCWPAEPLAEQLDRTLGVEAEDAALGGEDVVLRQGVDFDHIVLGVPLGGLPAIAAPLVAALPRWEAMLGGLPTTATIAAQLWLKADAGALGLPLHGAVWTASARPFETGADMSHLLPLEHYGSPRAVVYLTSVRVDPEVPAAHGFVTKYVHDQTREFLLGPAATAVWPRAPKGPARWDLLVDPDDQQGPARLAAQYLHASPHPSDRYVRSAPGTAHLRLPPDGAGLDNLWLAGDWVASGLDLGSVESACTAGRQAGRLLSAALQEK
jgi:uncharacterized protein with NAD-binding domain and iron-sulfur cluster